MGHCLAAKQKRTKEHSVCQNASCRPSTLRLPGRWAVRRDWHATNAGKAAPVSGENGEPASPSLGKSQAENLHFMVEFRNICDLGEPG